MSSAFWSLMFLSIAFTSTFVFAQDLSDSNASSPDGPLAKIKEIRGEVTYRGSPLHSGQVVSGHGLLVTGKGSYIKLFIAKWGNDLMLGPNTSMNIDLNAAETNKVFYKITDGVCRWKNLFHPKEGQPRGAVHTPTASLGVRGTDFLLIANPVLAETEIVLFDGKVEFGNLALSEDKVMINKGQWGGLGGRFGQKITTPMDLPESVLNHFREQLK